jgi:hypothetical protein
VRRLQLQVEPSASDCSAVTLIDNMMHPDVLSFHIFLSLSLSLSLSYVLYPHISSQFKAPHEQKGKCTGAGESSSNKEATLSLPEPPSSAAAAPASKSKQELVQEAIKGKIRKRDEAVSALSNPQSEH